MTVSPMRVYSLRKNGWDVNEFSDRVLELTTDGVWAEADPALVPKNPIFTFHGYRCENKENQDVALDSCRAMDSHLSRDKCCLFNIVPCLWPGLGQNLFETVMFHRAIRYARRAGEAYGEFIEKTTGPFAMMAHSLGCGVTGWVTTKLTRPAHLVVWMGAAVPQYATAGVDPHVENDDFLAKIRNTYLYDFGPSLRDNVTKLLNFRGDDPVLKGAFRHSVDEAAVGSHGPWPGPERFTNIHDVDLSNIVRSHGDYRHLPHVWSRVAAELHGVGK